MISLSSRYALRALAYLAHQKGAALSKEIAEELSISPTYLTKILQTLRKARILKATRGAKGGFVLDRDPSKVTFIEIISLFEDPKDWFACPFGQVVCKGDPKIICKLHCKWEKLSQSFSKFLSQATVSEISRVHSPQRIS